MNRRWFQLKLKFAMLLFLLATLACGYLASAFHDWQHEQRAVDRLKKGFTGSFEIVSLDLTQGKPMVLL